MNGINGPVSTSAQLGTSGAAGQFVNISPGGSVMTSSHMDSDGLQLGSHEDSFWTHMSLEDLRIAIQRLLKENADLKSTMLENNAAMEEQCELLQQWKERTEQERTSIVDKFTQAKTLIESLKLQKAELENKLEGGSLSGISRSSDVEISSLRRQVDELRRENQLLHDSKKLAEERTRDLEQQQIGATGVNSVDQVLGITSLCEQQEEIQQVFENYKRTVEKINNEVDVKSFQQLTQEFSKTSKQLDKVKIQIIQDCQKLVDENTGLKSIMQQRENEIERLSRMNEVLQNEKMNLTALNNELQTKFHVLQRNSPSREESTSVEIFDVRKNKATNERTSDDLSMTSLPEGYVDVSRQQEALQGQVQEPKKQQRQQQLEKTMSDLLIQLTEERSKYADCQAKLNNKMLEMEKIKKSMESKDEMIADLQKKMSTTVEKLTQEHQLKHNQLVTQMDSMAKELQEAKGFQHLKSQVMSLVSEVQEAEKKCEHQDRSLQAERERCGALQTKLGMLQNEMENQRRKDDVLIHDLKSGYQNLEAGLHSERQEKELHMKSLAELRKTYDRICHDYQDLLDSVERYKENLHKQGGPASKELTEKIDNLTAQLFAAEEALGSRNEKIHKLETSLKQIKEDAENAPVLRAQAEVYKTDFQAERRNREEAVALSNQLKEEIVHLQRQNQQLRDELETSNHHQILEMQRRHAASYRPELAQRFPELYTNNYAEQMGRLDTFDDERLIARRPGSGQGYTQMEPRGPIPADQPIRYPQEETHHAQEDDTETEDLKCFKCEKNFPDLDSLNLHVNKCLELDK